MKADLVIAKYNNNSNRVIDTMNNFRHFNQQDFIDEELITTQHA